MEQLLNCAWLLLALSMICGWLSSRPASAAERRKQFVALAILLMILFPVVSVSDDLLLAQSAAEDSWTCRKHVVLDGKLISRAAEGLPQSFLSAASLTSKPRVVEDRALAIAPSPCMDAIQNRPPPRA